VFRDIGTEEDKNKMAGSLQKLAESLQAEVHNLRAQISSGRPTPPKDLSLVSLIPKWSGTEEAVSVTKFFELVESSAKIGNWNDVDKIQVTVLKLTETVKAFYSSNLELHAKDITWENFKVKFLQIPRCANRSIPCHAASNC
jgi:hypothetical protein